MNETRTLPARTTQRTIFRVCGRPGLDDRPPLPPGHPLSWSLLTKGTALDGATYPFPVFNP